MKRRSWTATLLTITLLGGAIAGSLSGCGKKDTTANPNLDQDEEITLTVAGPWEDMASFYEVSQAFTELHPNCKIQYEYLQSYQDSLDTRLASQDNKLDLFFTDNIQLDSSTYPYAVNLYDTEYLDLSETFPGLMTNAEFRGSDGKAIYAVPAGGEIRGMYVNKTLLESLNLKVPTTETEFLDACQVLKENGYIPVQGNPGNMSQQLLYPYVCNLIANAKDYDETYQKVAECQPGVSELFAEPMQFMYTLMENGYYQYKYAETELGLFLNLADEEVAKDFLNIKDVGGSYEKADDVGQVAFMPARMSLNAYIASYKEDYHSKIDYEFILSPVSEEGGYAYLSPAKALAMNKNSDHLDWATEFMNYLYQPENNKILASGMNLIPNTKDALTEMSSLFDLPQDQISELGQVTFNYDFYSIIESSLVAVSKGNNPKYMQEDGSLYSYEYYMNQLEEKFAN